MALLSKPLPLPLPFLAALSHNPQSRQQALILIASLLVLLRSAPGHALSALKGKVSGKKARLTKEELAAALQQIYVTEHDGTRRLLVLNEDNITKRALCAHVQHCYGPCKANLRRKKICGSFERKVHVLPCVAAGAPAVAASVLKFGGGVAEARNPGVGAAAQMGRETRARLGGARRAGRWEHAVRRCAMARHERGSKGGKFPKLVVQMEQSARLRDMLVRVELVQRDGRELRTHFLVLLFPDQGFLTFHPCDLLLGKKGPTASFTLDPYLITTIST
ncbi:hypothetical protein FIBSPDRAFT_927753 [Athelia psychrophila]|uniref:Uncharacterized protein n=1 Tax=Athelia psychrophila TaxID=1759441 RepID=A0A166RAF6_9AGAM|nr:hypothetical protein FIBSPDRAFT_927753 [Fibularhizoctonia sp. CBS 109695]